MYVDIVFEGGDGPQGPRFVECEDSTGASVRFGTWIKRDDGYWVLRVPRTPVQEVDPSIANEQTPSVDSNVTALPGTEFEPYQLAKRVLDKVKEFGSGVRNVVAFVTVDTGETGTVVLPYCTDIGFAEMSMISATANAMTQRCLNNATRDRPVPQGGGESA